MLTGCKIVITISPNTYFKILGISCHVQVHEILFRSHLHLTSYVGSKNKNQFAATISNLETIEPKLIKIYSVTSEMIGVGQITSADYEFHSFILYTYIFLRFLVKPKDHLKS
jgi:hypothetical protein